MGPSTAPRTVFFADVAGSTRLYQELGDAPARALLLAGLDLVGTLVVKGGGTVIERIGDELMCTFPEPSAAAATASLLHIQLPLAGFKGELPRPLHLRIGFDHGEVIVADEGLFGNVVHTAARLASLAKAGQTLTTRETLDLLQEELRAGARPFDVVVLKGQTTAREIHELVVSANATVTSGAAAALRRPQDGGVRLEHGGRVFRVDANAPSVDVGRDPGCGICVAGDTVSRLHARISWNRGHVELEDVSSNGTVVCRGGDAPLRLRHEQAVLRGSGEILLGSDGSKQARIAYRCEP